MFKHYIFGDVKPLPRAMYVKFERQWIMDQRPGWTFEYIDNLSYAQRQEVIAYKGAKTQYKNHLRKS